MSANKDLTQSLVLLGKEQPQLRPHLRPILAALENAKTGRVRHKPSEMPHEIGLRNWADVWKMLLEGMPKDFRSAYNRKDASFFASLVLHHVYDTSGDYYDPRDPDPEATADKPLAPSRQEIERYIRQNWEDVKAGFDAHS